MLQKLTGLQLERASWLSVESESEEVLGARERLVSRVEELQREWQL